MKKIVIAVGIALSGVVAESKTVAWYRFEEEPSGTLTTSASVFTNTIDATKYPAYAGVCAFPKNNQYSKAGLSYTAANMPVYTNAFPDDISLLNVADCNREIVNNRALALNTANPDNRDNPQGMIFIDDHADLRLQTFTLEFFARLPDTTQGWRCLASRIGHEYNNACTAFNLYGSLLGNGNMYLMLQVATVENPLYDNQGFVTNQVVKELSASYAGTHIDNDRWHHIAIQVDGAAKKVQLFVDYVSRATANYTGDIFYEPGYPFAFGGHPQSYYYGSAESVDEIRISDEALPVTQMLGYKQRSERVASGFIGDNTLFYFPFEGSTEQITAGADDMQSPITYVPFLENQAADFQFAKVNAIFQTKDGSTPFPDADVPGASVRSDIRGEMAAAELTSCRQLTNEVGFANAVLIPNSVSANDIFGESCTVEFFFKAPPTGYMASNLPCHLFCMWSGMQVLTKENNDWNSGHIFVDLGGTKLRSTPTGNDYAAKGFINGQWHHCAIVWDKENERGDCYFDYKWVMGASSVVMNPAPHQSYINSFMMGGSYWGDRSLGNFNFDEVRITRGVLRPHQFLTTRAIEGGDLARASFENDLIMTPYTNFFGAAGVASAFTPTGSAPLCVASCPARIITEGHGGEEVVSANRSSLRFDGGKVLYADRALLADTDEFTVEFFLCSDSAAAGAGIARVNRGSSDAVTNAVTWALAFADAAGRLQLKVDTDLAEGQTHLFAAPFADGLWHHVGLRFTVAGANTVAELYRDAVLVGTWEINGRLLTNPREMNFMLGAGDDPSVGFNGWIDELRVTPGVRSASTFLTPVHRGLMIIVR